MRFLFFLLLSFIMACSTPISDTADSSDCGTQVNPYLMTSDLPDLILGYRIDYWVFLKDSSDFDLRYENRIIASVEKLNKEFAVANISFELNAIHLMVDKRKAENPLKFRQHAWNIDDWYWENRDTQPYALSVLVYPNKEDLFPGAAVDIPSSSFCIQEKFLLGSTLVHEAAHAWGGLYHTHQYDESDGRNFEGGDLICDIAYHPSLIKKVNQRCDEIEGTSVELTQTEEQVLIDNWMSYSLFSCRKSFSKNQIQRIRFTASNTSDIKRARID